MNGGRVLNCAIDKYIYVIVKQRFDDDIYVNYSKKEIVSQVEDLEHELVREAMLMTGVTNGVEITTLADIPSAGSGLGSSSTVTVGLLNALYAYQGRQVSAWNSPAGRARSRSSDAGSPSVSKTSTSRPWAGSATSASAPATRQWRTKWSWTRRSPRPPASDHAVLHRDHPEREHHPGRAERK